MANGNYHIVGVTQGYRDITPTMEHHMKKNMKHDMETTVSERAPASGNKRAMDAIIASLKDVTGDAYV